MTSPDDNLVFLRDLDAERAVARLRLVGAVVVGVSSVALAFGGGGTLRWLLVGLGLLAALGWLAASLRAGRVKDDGDRLELGPGGLKMSYRGTTRHIAWAALTNVEADEEKLVVRVDAGAEKLEVPLVWKGVGLHDLAATIEDAQSRYAP